MEEYFDCQDKQPHLNEIHLDRIEKRELWEIYKNAIIAHYADDEFVDYGTFCSIWSNSFPHVKIRKHKSVSGKCLTCHEINQLTLNSTEKAIHVAAKQLHLMHRAGNYMLERIAYKQSCATAKNEPTFLKFIIDGMDQNKCKIPQLGSNQPYKDLLVQHLQGCLRYTVKGNSFLFILSDKSRTNPHLSYL